METSKLTGSEEKQNALERPHGQPVYHHDCGSCTFLGTYNRYDLYHCLQGDRLATVIARCSDEPSDYVSGLEIAVSISLRADRKSNPHNVPGPDMLALRVAFLIAHDMGLPLR